MGQEMVGPKKSLLKKFLTKVQHLSFSKQPKMQCVEALLLRAGMEAINGRTTLMHLCSTCLKSSLPTIIIMLYILGQMALCSVIGSSELQGAHLMHRIRDTAGQVNNIITILKESYRL